MPTYNSIQVMLRTRKCDAADDADNADDDTDDGQSDPYVSAMLKQATQKSFLNTL